MVSDITRVTAMAAQTRSFCYVDDLIDGYDPDDGEAQTDVTGPINIGNPQSNSPFANLAAACD